MVLFFSMSGLQCCRVLCSLEHFAGLQLTVTGFGVLAVFKMFQHHKKVLGLESTLHLTGHGTRQAGF